MAPGQGQERKEETFGTITLGLKSLISTLKSLSNFSQKKHISIIPPEIKLRAQIREYQEDCGSVTVDSALIALECLSELNITPDQIKIHDSCIYLNNDKIITLKIKGSIVLVNSTETISLESREGSDLLVAKIKSLKSAT